MRPTQHRSTNDVLRAPAGASIEEVQPLHITRITYGPGGLPGVVSFWQPTAAEQALIAAGHPVRLSCLGITHPPVRIGVDGDGELEL